MWAYVSRSKPCEEFCAVVEDFEDSEGNWPVRVPGEKSYRGENFPIYYNHAVLWHNWSVLAALASLAPIPG